MVDVSPSEGVTNMSLEKPAPKMASNGNDQKTKKGKQTRQVLTSFQGLGIKGVRYYCAQKSSTVKLH